MMTLSHGQSEVERGFSINENVLMDKNEHGNYYRSEKSY